MNKDENTSRILTTREFIQREEAFVRASYNPEIEFYSYVGAGDVAKVKELIKEEFWGKREGWGTLSDNPLRNIKYHFTITTAMLARYCINQGMELQMAYNLSDYYIKKADTCTTIEEVAAIHPVMCLDYTKRMRDLQKKNIFSVHIVKCINYIYDHLHTRITASQLAELTGLSESYLSRIFKKETGSSISDYISEKKIQTARNMLQFSDYSLADISALLAFPSQSYFTEIFKKRTGCTPMEFRNKYGGTSAPRQPE